MLPIVIVGWTAIVLLNVFWLVWGFLYRGRFRRSVRLLSCVYAAVPFIVAGAFAFSVSQSPLRGSLEPFGSDGRPVAYMAAALSLASFVAVVGVIVLARSSAWQIEPADKT